MDKELKKEFDKLGQKIEDGFKESEKKTDEKIDNLAGMIKKEFDENTKQHKQFATKEDLIKLEIKMDKRFDKVDEEIREKFDKVLEGEDKILKRLTDLEIEDGAETVQLDRQRDKINEHEKRLKRLETKLGISYS